MSLKPWQFKAGESGNPGGRPKGVERQLREAYGKDAPALMQVMVDLALGRDVDGYGEIKASDRVKAGIYALDRIAGKPKESVDITGDVSPEAHALLGALRMTPHERRHALAQDTTEDTKAYDAACDE